MSETTTKDQLTYRDPWQMLCKGSPTEQEYRMRSIFMMAIRDYKEKENLSLEQAAETFGISKKRTEDILSGEINKTTFSLLFKIACRIGYDFTVDFDSDSKGSLVLKGELK